MYEKVEVARIDFGHTNDGRKSAVVTFKVTDENQLPSAINFEVDVIVRDDGDVGEVLGVAKRAFHFLTVALAEKTKSWAP